MKIIFLDFDGVMDTAYHNTVLVSKGLQETDEYGVIFDPMCIKNLETIIKSTRADIIVTSSWKYLMSYEELLKMWIRECKTECEYVIIDDLDSRNFNEHHLPHLITVNPYNGLDEIAAKQAIEILG